MRDIRKILGTLIGIIGFIAAMAGLTYAMYTFSDSNNNKMTGKGCINIKYEKGADASANEIDFQTTHTNAPIQTTLTFYQNATEECGKNNGTIYINTATSTSSNLLSSGVLKYTIEKQIGTNSVSETYTGYITTTGDTAVDVGLLEDEATTYTVYIWLEEDSTGNVTNATISEAVYSGYIHASASQSSTFKN